MIEFFLALVLLVLAGAIVVLFAMLGELAARVGVTDENDSVTPLEEAHIGSVPEYWPGELMPLVEGGDGSVRIVVLSTACGSCESVARQLVEARENEEALQAGVVVSCGDRRVGEDFVRRHELERLATFIDVGGDWVSGSFGVRTSPTGLVIRDGRLESAMVFTALNAFQVATVGTQITEEVAA